MISVSINDHNIPARLIEIFPTVADEAIPRANVALIEGIRIYPPYSYVSMERAGGWKSDRQRKYVMMMIRSGAIQVPYTRTYELQAGWRTEGDGRFQIVVNGVSYATHVYGPPQAYMMELRQWPLAVSGTFQLYMAGIMNGINAGVDAGLRKLGFR